MSVVVKLPREQIESLRPRDVQHYLTSRGWVVDAAESSPDAMVFQNPAMSDVELLLPLRHELGDYTLRMADIVHALSVVEKRSVWEILNDLSGPPADVLRLHVAAADATLGNLPLEEGIHLLRSGRDLLLAAACSTLRPQAFHPQKPLKQAHDFIKTCRLGQTERGSFVATLIVPVPPAPRNQEPVLMPFQEATAPFSRRVTTLLMNSLGIVENAIKAARIDLVLNGIENGISANLCDALYAMQPSGDQSRLDIRMSWSRSRPPSSADVPQTVTFAQTDFEIIADASRQLRERSRSAARYVGRILGLQSGTASLFDSIAGKIIVRTEVGGQLARIKIVLNPDEYRLACDAHRDGKPISVTGVIRQDVKVRDYELSEPRDFRVLEDPDPIEGDRVEGESARH